MRVFIDFDDVIFNTKKLKEDLRDLFLNEGISREMFEKYYSDPHDARVIKSYSPIAQLKRIQRTECLEVKDLHGKLIKLIDDLSGYVFEDVFDFVEFVGSNNLSIISYGDQKFQKLKIVNSKINEKILNTLIANKSKSEELRQYFIKIGNDFETTFFLDDRIEQIRDIKEKFPKIITILVKRPEGRYQEMQKEKCCDFEVHDLKEAHEIIKKIIRNEHPKA